MKKKKYVMVIIGALLSSLLAYQQGIAGSNHGDQSKRTKKNHMHGQDRSYPNALKTLWTKVYPDQGETLYCGKPFSTKDRYERKKIANAEHVFPMGWVTRELKCGTRKKCQANNANFRQIEADLHNIFPAQIHVNKARGSLRFGEISGEKRMFGKCDFEVSQKKRVAEPAEAVRGEIARAMLYMSYQYNLKLHQKTFQLMKAWDKQDPPSAEEKRREKIIAKEQGRENPFIRRYPFNPDE